MKNAKIDTKQKPKPSLKEFGKSIIRILLSKKWFFLSAAVVILFIGLVIYLSSPVPVRAQIISQKWDSLSFISQETRNQPGFMRGTAKKFSMRFYKQSLEQNVSMQISSPNIKIYDITDYYQPPIVNYSAELGGYYLSMHNLTNGQNFDLSINGELDNIQDKQINLNDNTILELLDVKNNGADINTPSVLMIANGSLDFWWNLPIDCSFNILNWKDYYTNNFPSLNISSQCLDVSANSVDIQLTKYLPDGGTRVIIVTNGMTFLGNEVIGNQDKQYLLVLDRGNNYSDSGVKIVANVSNLDLDATYEPENLVIDAEYLTVFNPGYSYSISNSVGKIKLGSQTITTDEYSDIDVESKNGNFAIDFQGNTNNESSPFIVQSRTLTSSLEINFDEMIKKRWSVFPVEIWSAIIGGIMTILGTYIGYLLGRRKSTLS